jgi:DNA primase
MSPDTELQWSETELPTCHAPGPEARLYLQKRGISGPDSEKLGIMEWADEYRLIIPYFERGECIFWTSRRFSAEKGQGPKYLSQPGKKPLYITPFLGADPCRNLVLVEGVFDAIRVSQAGYRAVALGGKSLPPYHIKKILTLAQKCDIIYVFLDLDAISEAIGIGDELLARTEPETFVRLKCPPPGKDPADMTLEEIRKVLK